MNLQAEVNYCFIFRSEGGQIHLLEPDDPPDEPPLDVLSPAAESPELLPEDEPPDDEPLDDFPELPELPPPPPPPPLFSRVSTCA